MVLPPVTWPPGGWLDELYRRELRSGDAGVDSYYESGHGYAPPTAGHPARDRFGVAVAGLDGALDHAGDHALGFPLQSISKVFAFALALADHGRDAVLRRVGVEPSGDAFNSITFDERNRRPHNPMVNAGALATTDLVRGADGEDRLARILDLVRRYAGNEEIAVDEGVFEREMVTADRNRATAYLMRSQGMLGGDVEQTLALYLRQCAITVTCDDLARIGATLANGCRNPGTGERGSCPGA